MQIVKYKLTCESIYNKLKNKMAQIRLTLQNRITSLMIVSSVLFITAFTLIQLNNQIEDINRYNTYKANLSSIIVKNNLEAVIRQAQPEEVSRYVELGLKELQDAQIINEALVFDRDGKIVATTGTQPTDENVLYKYAGRIQMLDNLAKENKWLSAEINTAGRRLDMYLALRRDPEGPISHIAKLSFQLGNIQEALFGVYRPVLLATLIIILANILFGYLLSKTVIGPIRLLNEVTKLIAGGDLSIRTRISTNDELEELGLTFNYMTEQLVKMKERAENANPLTKLPGNIVIREETEKRIKNNQKFVVIYCDLNNFKAFNDRYGIAQGDEAIKLCSDIFKEAIKAKGNLEDFIGHEGGDDFIILTSPEKAQGISEYIIREFDNRVVSLYAKEDLERGHIIAHARDGTIRQFAIMTISLAGVSNELRTISSYAEVTNIAAEVKQQAKLGIGSNFVLDRRRG